MRGQPGLNTQPHARLPSSFLGMVYLTNKCSFDSQATWVIGVLGLCTTRHWQISRQLVQELNVTKFTQYIVFRKVEQNQATLVMGLPSMNGLIIPFTSLYEVIFLLFCEKKHSQQFTVFFLYCLP